MENIHFIFGRSTISISMVMLNSYVALPHGISYIPTSMIYHASKWFVGRLHGRIRHTHATPVWDAGHVHQQPHALHQRRHTSAAAFTELHHAPLRSPLEAQWQLSSARVIQGYLYQKPDPTTAAFWWIQQLTIPCHRFSTCNPGDCAAACCHSSPGMKTPPGPSSGCHQVPLHRHPGNGYPLLIKASNQNSPLMGRYPSDEAD